MTHSRIFRVLFVGSLVAAVAGIVAFTCWLFVWPIVGEYFGIDPLRGTDLWNTQDDDDGSQPRTGVPIALFSPNGRFLIALSDEEEQSSLNVWDVSDKSLQSRVTWNPRQCDHLAVTRDGSIAVTVDLAESYASGGTPPSVPALATSWDVATGKKLAEITLPTTPIWSVALSPDGKTLAVGTGDHWNRKPGTVEFWDLEKGQIQNVLREETATVTALSYSPDGSNVVVGTGIPHAYPQLTGGLRVFDLAGLKEAAVLTGHITGITLATFSADGSTLATVGYRRPVLVWDTQTWQLRATIDESKASDFSVDSVALSSDGSILATGHTYSVLLWDAHDAKKLGSIEVPLSLGGVKRISFGQDDLLVLPSQHPRLTPFVVDVRSGLGVSWELPATKTPKPSYYGVPITYRQIAAWQRRLKRRIAALEAVEFETKEILSKLAAEARPGTAEADLLQNVGVAFDDIDFLLKPVGWQSQFTDNGMDYRLVLFTPVAFAVPPGSPPQTVAILDSHDRIVLWQEIGGGGHGFDSAALDTEDGRTILSMTCRTRIGRPETTKYLVSPKSIEKFHVRPVEIKTGPPGEREKLGGAIGVGPFSTDVTSVSFSETEIGDGDLAQIVTLLRECPKLERLVLSGTKITSAGLKHLQNLNFYSDDRTFRGPSLFLDRTQIDDEGLQFIQHMTNLRELHLYETAVRGPGLAHLKGLVSLEHLLLSGTQVSDAGIAHLPELPNLVDLSIRRTLISDIGLERLSLLKKLQHLGLDDTRVTGPGLRHLSSLAELRNLSLSGAPVTGEGFEPLKSLSKLQELQLLSTPLTDEGLEQVAKVTSLTRLDISLTKIGDEGIAHLRALKNLDYLYLRDTNVSDAGVDALMDLNALSYLDIRGAKLTKVGFDRLRNKPSLHSLNGSEPRQALLE